MQRKATAIEAKKLIEQFGAAAYGKALEAERKARRGRNARLAGFLSSVAKRIAKDTNISGQRERVRGDSGGTTECHEQQGVRAAHAISK